MFDVSCSLWSALHLLFEFNIQQKLWQLKPCEMKSELMGLK